MQHLPPPEAESDRIQEQSLRRRLLTGAWARDAANREADLFAPEVREMLPPAELSHNPFATTHQQIACLYDEDPELEPTPNTGDTTGILTPDLWPLCQERQLYQSACNECGMRVDVWPGTPATEATETSPALPATSPAITYRVVYPDLILVATPSPDGRDPQVATRIEEARERINAAGQIVWTKEVWDVSDPTAPVFEIHELAGDGTWTDQTAYYAEQPGWPPQYRDLAGNPVLPYVVYHKALGSHMWSPFRGHELALGTLTVAAAWTMWLSGLRDGSHPQRVLLDGEVQVTAQAPITGAQILRMNPQTILQVKSIRRSDNTYSSPSVTQWQPAMEPKPFGESVTEFEASLAVHAGLSPSDVQKGHDNMSGYAIVVSRSGQRKASKRMLKPCMFGDQLLLSKAAALWNAANGTQLASENPADYQICYEALDALDLTHEDQERMEREEEKAKAENLAARLTSVEKMMSLGLIDKAQALALLSGDLAENFGAAATTVTPPDVKPILEELDTALETGDMASAQELAGELKAMLTGEQPAAPTTSAPAPDAVIDSAQAAIADTGVKAADTALNGAQVQAAQGIVNQVATRQLPREAGVQMLIEFFNIDPAKAERIMGNVGRSFFVEVAP